MILRTLTLLIFPGAALMASAADIMVSPAERLWLTPLEVTVTGAAPGARVQIEASLNDGAGAAWTSRGTYTADLAGVVRVGDTASYAGTYTGIDPRGLIWSMLPTDSEGLNTCLEEKCISANAPYWPQLPPMEPTTITYRAIVEVAADDDRTETVATSGISRYAADGVTREVVTAGELRGVFFRPAGDEPAPAAMIISGSGGGVSESTAALLASHGIATFALGYFNYEDRPEGLTNIPLEYFREGLDWLAAKTSVERVGLFGGSRGGEGVMIIASTFPEKIGALVSSVPSNVVQPGCCGPADVNKPAWTLAGEPLPYAPYRLGPDESFETKFATAEDADEWRRFYLPGMLAEGEAAIPVENIDAPILFITGDADALWPGEVAADLMMRRLAERAFAHPAEHLKLSGAGHFAVGAVPVTSMLSRVMYHPLAKAAFSLGGTPALNAASARSFARMVGFFKTHLPVAPPQP